MITKQNETIAILGISNHEERYAFMAYRRLLAAGYNHLIGVSPKELKLDNIEIVGSIDQLIGKQIHTLTMYVGEAKSTLLIDKIMQLNPKRIIFNPGSENQKLENEAKSKGIEVIHGCTLVMLSTDQF